MNISLTLSSNVVYTETTRWRARNICSLQTNKQENRSLQENILEMQSGYYYIWATLSDRQATETRTEGKANTICKGVIRRVLILGQIHDLTSTMQYINHHKKKPRKTIHSALCYTSFDNQNTTDKAIANRKRQNVVSHNVTIHIPGIPIAQPRQLTSSIRIQG